MNGQTDLAVTALRTGRERVSGLLTAADRDSRNELRRLNQLLTFTLADTLTTTSAISPHSEEQPEVLLIEEEVRELIGELRRQTPGSLSADFVEANLLLRQFRWKAARPLLETLVNSSATPASISQRAVLALSECFRELQNPQAERSLLRSQLSDEPLWFQGRLQLAESLAASGQLDAAIEEYRKLSRLPQSLLPLARLLAMKQLTLPATQRDWDEVEQLLGQSVSAGLNLPEVSILTAEVLFRQGEFEQARQRLVSAAGDFPENPAIRAALAELLLRETGSALSRRLDRAAEIIQQSEKELGPSAELSLALANLAAQQSLGDSTESLRRIEQTTVSLTPEDRYRVLNRVIEVLRQTGQHDAAWKLMKQLAASYPQKLQPQTMLARVSIDRRDPRMWQDSLAAVRRIEGGGGPSGNYLEALGLMELDWPESEVSTRLDNAKILLHRASVARPHWSLLHRALGNLTHRMGDRDTAFAQFQNALEDGDESREVVEYVVRHLYQNRRFDEADRVLQQVATRRPNLLSGELARVAWQVAWEQRQFDDWVRVTEDMTAQSGDFRDRILLSQFRFARGRRGEEVEQPLREAVRMAPEAPQPRLALVSYLARVDQTEAARQAVEAVRNELPATLSPLIVAQCHEILGEQKQAEEAYLAALELEPDDFSRLITVADFFIRQQNTAQAEKYLAAILKEQSTAPQVAVTWARRRQSLMIGSSGRYRDTARALELLQKNLDDDQSPEAEDLLAQSHLLARRNNRRDQLRAIQILEQVATQQQLPSTERFTLAVLHEATGNWPVGRSLLLELLTQNQSQLNPARLAFYVEASLRHGELNDALLWMDRLEQLQPETFRTVSLRSRCLVALENRSAAVEHLRTFLQQQSKEQQNQLLPRAAALCRELGEPAIAEEFLRSYAAQENSQRARLLLARFLAGQNQLDEAMIIWEAACSTKTPPDLLAAAGVSLVSHGNATEVQLDSVDQWFDSAIDTGRPPAAVVLAQGDLRMLQRRFEEAGTLYRLVLRQAPENLIALNNLAWLLAYRGTELSEALKYIETAIDLAGPTAALRDTRAMVHMAAGQLSAALQDLEPIAADLPEGIGLYHLTLLHRQRDALRDARQTWQQAHSKGLSKSSLHPLEQLRYDSCRKWIDSNQARQ
ncbi:MAG: hypothetical protein KDA79_16410 [Planctomycetaceae bacterium]|nr:hypothetical protein [Planctomycetaceae bacterium]